MFEFVTATRIIFGKGSLATGIESASRLGRKALVVHGTGKAPLTFAFFFIKKENVTFVESTVEHEPSVALVQEYFHVCPRTRM